MLLDVRTTPQTCRLVESVFMDGVELVGVIRLDVAGGWAETLIMGRNGWVERHGSRPTAIRKGRLLVVFLCGPSEAQRTYGTETARAER